ncbi:IS200/IS605 family transposase [Levilactobacillus parabrevis]|uniref:IS200/IS605 family transposase n=1 Tax=Levilactobacillus parabrevis TaxID=357278 RepID=UPI00375709EB
MRKDVGEIIHELGYVYNFHFHLVWVTKYRHEAFTTPKLVAEMADILTKIARLNEVTIEQMEVMPDHIHLLLSFKPKYAPTNVVKAFKGGSARLFFELHPEIKAQKFWGGHLWSSSYFMSTLGDTSKKTVENYIASQRKR